jgi:hypothetical protein
VKLAEDVVGVADDHRTGEIEPARTLVLQVEGRPPQPPFCARAHGAGQRRKVAFQGIGDHREALRLGGKRIEGIQRHPVEGFAGRALGRGVEAPDTLDPVVIEHHSQRSVAAIVNVDDPAPNRELTGLLDQIDPPVAGRGEPYGEPPLIEPIPDLEALDLGGNRGRNRERPEQRARRDDDHLDVAVVDPPEQPDQLEPGGERRLGTLVGGAEVGRRAADTEARREQLEARRQVLGVGSVGHHHGEQPGPPAAEGQRRHHERPGAGNHPADGERPAAGVESLAQRAEIGMRKG